MFSSYWVVNYFKQHLWCNEFELHTEIAQHYGLVPLGPEICLHQFRSTVSRSGLQDVVVVVANVAAVVVVTHSGLAILQIGAPHTG